MNAIYTVSALQSMSVAQLKVIANQIGAIPDGDKRSKQTWIDAIVNHQIAFGPAKVEAMQVHIAAVVDRQAMADWVTQNDDNDVSVADYPADDHWAETEGDYETVDSYVPTPRTHADDVALAEAMGLTYDDVFAGGLEPSANHPAPSHAIVAIVIITIVGALLWAVTWAISYAFRTLSWIDISRLSPWLSTTVLSKVSSAYPVPAGGA